MLSFHEETFNHITLLHITSDTMSSLSSVLDHSHSSSVLSNCSSPRNRRRQSNNNNKRRVSWSTPDPSINWGSSTLDEYDGNGVHIQVIPIPHVYDMSTKDIGTIWYQSKDYKYIKEECRKTWELVQRRVTLPSNLCQRGLEEDIDKELERSIGIRQRKSVAVVLQEQERQTRQRSSWRHGSATPSHMSSSSSSSSSSSYSVREKKTIGDDLILSNLYQEATKVSCQAAYNRGCQDALEVLRIRNSNYDEEEEVEVFDGPLKIPYTSSSGRTSIGNVTMSRSVLAPSA
jgi:hypothetical protein